MKVKYANKVYEVLYTMKVLGKPIYAVEDEPNHIDWLVNVEVIDEEEESSIKWNKNTEDNKPSINHSILMKTIHGIAEGEWKGGESWYQYRWKSHVKDSDVLAWMELSDLDKQDEQKPIWSKFDELMLNDALEFIESGWSGNGKSYLVYWLKSIKNKFIEKHKKQNMQKSMNEAEQKDVKLKFNVGDWIIYDNNICKIYKTTPDDKHYCCFDINDNIHIYNRSLEDKFQLWTINNAKDGDVLWHSDSASNGIFIYKGIKHNGKVLCYCDYDSEDHFCLGEHHTCCWINDKYVKPATKEQRELLFQKMKEANFEWDADKKELKKIEVEPENYKQQLMSETLDLVKDYIQQKSAWTEDDEKKRTLLIKILEANHPHGLFKVNSSETMRTEELVSWLKSLNS